MQAKAKRVPRAPGFKAQTVLKFFKLKPRAFRELAQKKSNAGS
jgi:hypothetical protein